MVVPNSVANLTRAISDSQEDRIERISTHIHIQQARYLVVYFGLNMVSFPWHIAAKRTKLTFYPHYLSVDATLRVALYWLSPVLKNIIFNMVGQKTHQ